MFIYAAKNIVSGKVYVGLTALSVPARWAAHLKQARGNRSKSALHCALRKYGPGVFVVEEVAALMPGLSYADLCQLERDIIAQEGCMVPHGYNMTSGGEGFASDSWTPEMRAAAADRAREQLAARETPMRGPKRHTDEWKAARSAATKGKGVSPERAARAAAGKIAAFADPIKGPATRAKIKAGWTDERRAAASARTAVQSAHMNMLRAAKRTNSEVVH